MTQVSPVTVTFNGNQNGRTKTENAAVGVGAAGATAAYASRKAASKGVWATVGNTASKATQMTQKTLDTMTMASKNVGWFKRLGAAFRLKKAAYIQDFTKLADKVKNVKFIGAVLNNPIAKKAGSAFGGVMAFFVLVPSIMNMVDVADKIASH